MSTQVGPDFTRSFIAGGTITKDRVVYVSDANTVLQSDEAAAGHGVAQEDATSGNYVSVNMFGPSRRMTAGGAITAPATVLLDTAGRVVTTATDGSYHIGIALHDVAAAGDVIEILLLPFQTEDVSDHTHS